MNFFTFLKAKSSSHSYLNGPANAPLGKTDSVNSIENIVKSTSPLATNCDQSSSSLASSSISLISSSNDPSLSFSESKTVVKNENKKSNKKLPSWSTSHLFDPTMALPNQLTYSSPTKEVFKKPQWAWSKKNLKYYEHKQNRNMPPVLSQYLKSEDTALNEADMFCNICLQNLSLYKAITLKECRCQFCIECLRTYVEVKLQDNQSIILCPQSVCDLKGQVTQEEISSLTNTNNYKKYLKLRQEKEINTDKSRIWCPHPDCGTIVLLKKPMTDKNQIVCPTCKTIICASCSTPWHDQHQCLDQLLELSDIIKRCPRCRIPIERDAGCAQILCQTCHHAFCWYCLKSIEHDYLLLHYGKGNCKGKLGHGRAALWTLRAAIVFGFVMTGAMALIWVPFLLVTVGPCYLCQKKCFPKQK